MDNNTIYDEEEKTPHPPTEDSDTSLADREKKEGDSGTSEKTDDSPQSGWKVKLAKQKAKATTAKISAGKWAAIIGGSGMILVVVFFFFLLLSSLGIPNLAQNIAGYEFARTARIFTQSASDVTAESIALDSVDGAYASSKGIYGSLRDATWGKLDAYRPKKVLQNMRATKELDFNYEEGSGSLFKRPKLESVVIGGEEIAVADKRFGRIFSNYSERIRFAAQIQANIDASLDGSSSLVRGSVAKSIREDLGIKLRWWEKLGSKYKGLKAAEQDRLQARDAAKAIDQDDPVPSGVKQVQETIDEAEQQRKADLADDAVLDEMIKDGKVQSEAEVAAIDSGLAPSALESSVKVASTAYAIAVPLCIVYDGSIQKAGPDIDLKNAQLQRSYYAVASAADQQKAGGATAEAIGAMNRKIKGADSSIPLQRAAGNTLPKTDLVPQGTANGDFTILTALFGDNKVARFVGDYAEKACPTLTDWRTGVAVGIADVIGKIASGGETAAAEQVAQTTITEYLGTILKRAVIEGAAIGATTYAAKLLVLSKMGTPTSGLARDATFANQADAGADLHSQDLNRQQFYGRPMTAPEIAMSNQQDREYLAKKQSSESLYARYISVDNPYSLRQKLATNVATFAGGRSVEKLLSKSISSINPVRLMGSVVNSLLSRKMSAQDVSGDPYKIMQWGWTAEETNLIGNNQSYSVLENSKQLEESGRTEEIKTKYGTCFTKSIGDLVSEQMIERNQNGDIVDNPEKTCSPGNLGPNNQKGFADLVFRYRLNMRNQNTLDHLTSIQGAN